MGNMWDAQDFLIENGVMEKYVGIGGDVVIPDSVTSIDPLAFADCKNTDHPGPCRQLCRTVCQEQENQSHNALMKLRS